jgi:hypothetical protein
MCGRYRGDKILELARHRTLLPGRQYPILLVTIQTELSWFPTVISLCIKYVETRSLNTVGYFCRQDMLCLILWRTWSRQGISEDSCQQRRTWISIKPADGLRRTSFKFLKLYFFGARSTEADWIWIKYSWPHNGTPLNACICDSCEYSNLFSFYICLKASLLQE